MNHSLFSPLPLLLPPDLRLVVGLIHLDHLRRLPSDVAIEHYFALRTISHHISIADIACLGLQLNEQLL